MSFQWTCYDLSQKKLLFCKYKMIYLFSGVQLHSVVKYRHINCMLYEKTGNTQPKLRVACFVVF